MLKIDIHNHILPRDIPNWKDKFGYGGFIRLEHSGPGCARMMKDDGHFFREIEDNSWSVARRIEQMDAAGVSVQVLSTVPVSNVPLLFPSTKTVQPGRPGSVAAFVAVASRSRYT
jgi:aminocarboxymuconate-semialdehyde decarboxylase